MPELNRDKERLYRPGKLSVWFLVSSGLLLASLVWMVVADYARPWKRVQKDYYAKRTEVLRARQEAARAELLKGEELRALAERVREERRKFEQNPDVARLRSEIQAAQRRREQLEARFKEVSGTWAERKYELEKTQVEASQGRATAEDVAEVEAEYARLVAERDRLAGEVAAPAAEQAEKERQLAALEESKKEIEKEWERKTTPITAEETRIADAQAKGGSAWRNALGVDFLVPTIRPRKVVNEHVHDDFNFATSAKVDMCMSCHMGIDDPVMRADASSNALLADGTPTKVALPPEYRAHPHLDLILGPSSPHPMERIGCTVCHAGRGWSLDFQRAAHTPRDAAQTKDWKDRLDWEPARWVDFPMLPLPYVQGQCWKCHVEGIHYPVEVLHPELEAKVAKETLPSRARREPEALYRHELAYVPAGERAARDATGRPILVPKALDYRVPDPADASKRVDALLPWKNSVVPGVRADTDGDGDVDAEDSPELFAAAVAKAPPPVDDPSALADAAWRATGLERGQEIVREYGCYGCHVIEGFPKVTGFPREAGPQSADFSTPAPGTLINGLPKVGWDLTHAADKLTPKFLRAWLRDPTSYRRDTKMPAFWWHTRQDRTWKPVRTAEGKPDQVHVHDESAQVRLESEVEIEAIASFLQWASKKRPAPYPEPPAGDPKRGSDTFFSIACYGCHVGPDRWKDESWVEDDGARFGNEPAQGPRLTAMASKLQSAGWLYAWLAEPRHYWSTTRMPRVPFRDELGPDGKTVVRTADQARADVVAYLMRGRDADFEAQEMRLPRPPFTKDEKGRSGAPEWTPEHTAHLTAMWKEYYAKGLSEGSVVLPDLRPGDATSGYVPVKGSATRAEADARMARMGMLAAVGEKVITSRGCFGCHNIAGTEASAPIGKELKNEGLQDIHKFDFGFVHDIGHTRWEWIQRKVHDPRGYDRGKIKLWTERLKMPRFNLQPTDQEAVTGFVLGMVLDEPIGPQARYQPDDAEREILAGRAVVARYGCNNCHTIEGKIGLLTKEQKGQEGWMLPPNLFGVGNRRRPEELFRFLKEPKDLRPGVIQQMPTFRLSDAEASALVGYFNRLAGRDRTSYDPLDAPLDTKPYAEPKSIEVTRNNQKQTITVRTEVEQAKALFDAFACAKCHLPKGTPGADPNEGGSAPPFTVVGPMLRRDWVVALLRDPQTQIHGTKMTQFWTLKTKTRRKVGETLNLEHPNFRFDAAPDATNDEVAEAQMKALARYLIYHYDPTITPPAEPAAQGR